MNTACLLLMLALVGVAVAYMPYTRDDIDRCCICATGFENGKNKVTKKGLEVSVELFPVLGDCPNPGKYTEFQ